MRTGLPEAYISAGMQSPPGALPLGSSNTVFMTAGGWGLCRVSKRKTDWDLFQPLDCSHLN